MKKQFTYREILLFTGTSFASRSFCPIGEENGNEKKLSPIEELERACWAGMLCELLPELAGSPSAKTENIIWNILSGKKFLYISIGPAPLTANQERCIDPYLFTPCQN